MTRHGLSTGMGGDGASTSPSAVELEPAIRAMIDATNNEDRASLLDAFATERS